MLVAMAATDEAKQLQIDRILQSETLRNSDVLRLLLRYLADKSLSGDSQQIKEYSIAKRDKTGPSSGFDVKFLEGSNDWPAIMKALDEVGYQGWGIAEQPGADSPEGLKDLSDRMSRIFAS